MQTKVIEKLEKLNTLSEKKLKTKQKNELRNKVC